MAQNEEPAPAAAATPAKGGNKLVPIMLVANVAMMGVVIFMVMRKPSSASATPSAEPASHEEKSEKGEGASPGGTPRAGALGPILKLENFVIQLRGIDQDRYVRVSFDMEVTSDPDREVVQARLPQIRDSVISYFSDRSLDELRGSEGIEKTKTAIMKRLEEIVPGRRVRALYLTDFIIQ
jgi:flagellar FliL protein